MEATATLKDGAVILNASGSIDHSTAGAFEASALPAVTQAKDAGGLLVVDLSDVDYMSSVGLRVLMLLAKSGKNEGVKVVIAGLGDALREIFQISRFDKIFDIFDTADAALAAKG